MRTLRYVLSALIGVLIAFGILVPAASMVAPAFGREIFAIRGHSMSPTIPMGAAILVSERDVADVRPGDIVTWQSPNGAYVTHRVLQVVEENGQPFIQTKGDANDSPDPSAVPAHAFVGVVDGWLPAAGYGMILMGTPAGLISWLSFGLALLVTDAYIASLMTDRAKATEKPPRKRRATTDVPRKKPAKATRVKEPKTETAAGTEVRVAAVRRAKGEHKTGRGVKTAARAADPPRPAAKRAGGATPKAKAGDPPKRAAAKRGRSAQSQATGPAPARASAAKTTRARGAVG